MGKGRGDRDAEDLLLPCPSDHQYAEGDGGWPVADYLHPDGSLAHRASAPNGGQGRNARATKQNQPAFPV
ncbi:hypothetical protein D3C76_1572480 [compost metagenome]